MDTNVSSVVGSWMFTAQRVATGCGKELGRQGLRMRLKVHQWVAVSLVWTLLAAPSMAGDASVVKVRMTVNKKFVPATVTIKVGDSVEWIADDPFHQHSVTTDASQVEDRKLVQIPLGAKPFNSGLIEPGKSFRYRFTVTGTYKYVCSPHEQSNMVGTIVVTP
jgi:plastocyanin